MIRAVTLTEDPMATQTIPLDQALRDEVNRRGISYRAAGDLIGVPYQTLSNWATAKYRPSRPEDMTALARFLRVKVADVRAMRTLMGSGKERRLDLLEKELTALREAVERLAARIAGQDDESPLPPSRESRRSRR